MQDAEKLFTEIVQPVAEKYRQSLNTKGFDVLPLDISHEGDILKSIPNYSNLLPIDFTAVRVPPPGSVRFKITIDDMQSGIVVSADYWPTASLDKCMVIPFEEINENKINQVMSDLLNRWK